MIKIKIRKIYTTHINHVAGLPKLVRRDNIFTNRHQSCQPYIYFITYVATRYTTTGFSGTRTRNPSSSELLEGV